MTASTHLRPHFAHGLDTHHHSAAAQCGPAPLATAVRVQAVSQRPPPFRRRRRRCPILGAPAVHLAIGEMEVDTTLSASPAHAAALAGAAKGQARSSSFPKTSSKSVAYWLLGSAASVFGIVIFGGLTRLTESG
jgi:hypothetical protein